MKPEINYEAGETPMTDYQFKCFMELKDKVTELTKEIEALREENAALKKKLENS